MALIEGASLDQLIHRESDDAIQYVFDGIQSDWSAVAKLGASVASAIEHAHRQGIIHRDVKPANLLLDHSGVVWVTDFGLAKIFDDLSDISKTGEMIGTPRYMAPEQLCGHVDARTDVYAMGLTLYELVTGKRSWSPVQKSTNGVHRVLFIPDVRDSNPEVPDGLARIIMKACEHHPEDRYQSARELRVALNSFAFSGSQDRRKSRLAKTASIRPAAAVVGAVCFAFVAALTSWNTIVQRTRTQSEFPKRRKPKSSRSGLQRKSLQKSEDRREHGCSTRCWWKRRCRAIRRRICLRRQQ